jgi:hypothetical protein
MLCYNITLRLFYWVYRSWTNCQMKKSHQLLQAFYVWTKIISSIIVKILCSLCPLSVDKKLYHRLPNRLPLSFGVILPRNNVEKSENPIRINRQDMNAMKSVMRTIKRVVTQDKRKRIVTLRPKGTKSDYNGCKDVIGNGQTVFGLQVASKAFTIICDVELGKPCDKKLLPCHAQFDWYKLL